MEPWCECSHFMSSHSGDFCLGACLKPGCECKMFKTPKNVSEED